MNIQRFPFKILCLTFLLGALTAGCRKGPDRNDLRDIIETRLNDNFEEGLFRVIKFSRRGSYSYQDEGERLLVYYKARLEFLKDYRLAEWDSLNVGSLISILGSTPQGIDGVSPEGNPKGSTLMVYGAIPFKKNNRQWSLADYGPGETAGKPADGDTESVFEDDSAEQEYWIKDLPWHKQYILSLNNVVQDFVARGEDRNISLLRAQLEDVLREADLQAGNFRGWTTLVTGSPQGEYYAIGKGLETVLHSKENTAKAYATSGSVDNCRFVHAKQALLGITQSDIAALAYRGKGFFKKTGRLDGLRAVAALYPEAVQVVVAKDSGIRSLKDLKGKRISIGSHGSGMRANAIQVLNAIGLKAGSFSTAEGLNIADAADEFRRGEIDAVFVTSAYPASMVQMLSSRAPIRLIGLDHKTISLLTRRYGLIRVKIPRNTYIGMEKPVTTVGTTAMIVTHKDVENRVVTKLLDRLYANVTTLTHASHHAGVISKNKAKTGVRIPFHPAAQKYLAQN